jgi:hypothetical protein
MMSLLTESTDVVTRATEQRTSFPVWNEPLSLPIARSNVHADRDVIMTIHDKYSNEVLARYGLGVDWLEPYHQYNLELVHSFMSVANSPTKAHITATLKVLIQVQSINQSINQFHIIIFATVQSVVASYQRHGEWSEPGSLRGSIARLASYPNQSSVGRRQACHRLSRVLAANDQSPSGTTGY